MSRSLSMLASIAIADVQIPRGRRPINQDRVRELADSMSHLGLLNPITITPDKHLVAGNHRVEAAQLLGWTTIPAIVRDLSSLDAELAEIDENLIRNELTVLERSEMLARRKSIYEALHPETKRGGAPGKAGGKGGKAPSKTPDSGVLVPGSFVEDTASKTGTAKSTVYQEVQIAAAIPEDVRDAVRSTSLADSKTDLLELARQKPEKQREIVAKVKSGAAATVKEAMRGAKEEQRQEKRAINRALVEKAPDPLVLESIYSTIVIDPPWDWGDEGDIEQFGRAKPTYSTMTIEQLMNYPAVKRAAAKDCHLYLWITNRSLPKGFALMAAWGFRYVTCLTWCKPSIGMGNYFRGSTEQVLFGVRGSLSLQRKNVGTWFSAPRGDRHSAKPNEFYRLVESCSPGPRLELFARGKREGWVCSGAEV